MYLYFINIFLAQMLKYTWHSSRLSIINTLASFIHVYASSSKSWTGLNRSWCGKCHTSPGWIFFGPLKTQVHRKHFPLTSHFSKLFSFFLLSTSAQHNTNRSKHFYSFSDPQIPKVKEFKILHWQKN